ncbi:MAG TPA: SDR family oxidoreductase [Terriglobales bacterium]|nr:SDR family oxidoreductase [Terriglobales bacterium]
MQKIALITGSSSGIGLLSAVELARRNYHVIATMRDPSRRERLDKAAAEAKISDRIEVAQLDVTQPLSISHAVQQTIRNHQRIDVLVNNAGFAMAGFAEDLYLDEIRKQFETNFFGHVAVTKEVIPFMRAQKSGRIIMVTSIAGRVGQPVVGSYSASKFALEGWSEALRIELRSLGIRVVLVEPGAFETDIWVRNVEIGKLAMDASAPNHARAQRFSEFVKKNGDKGRPSAEAVAHLIGKVADHPNPKLRYVIGTDAKMALWMRALLPWKSYEKMVEKFTQIG